MDDAQGQANAAKQPAYYKMVNQRNADLIYKGVVKALVKGRKYRERSYTARQLAHDLNTNTRYLSAVLALRFRMNYTSLVNKLRVDEAKRILADEQYSELSMQDVADMVGFASRQTFHASFLKYVGVTPRQYRQQQ